MGQVFFTSHKWDVLQSFYRRASVRGLRISRSRDGSPLFFARISTAGRRKGEPPPFGSLVARCSPFLLPAEALTSLSPSSFPLLWRAYCGRVIRRTARKGGGLFVGGCPYFAFSGVVRLRRASVRAVLRGLPPRAPRGSLSLGLPIIHDKTDSRQGYFKNFSLLKMGENFLKLPP